MESIFKAREPSADGLEAEPKSGGQQASAEECIFKTCTLQGFGNVPFFILTLSQLFFHFCSRPAHHNSFYHELRGPAGSMISGVKISCNESPRPWQGTAEPPSRDSLGSRAASSCRSWARDSSFAFQQCPHQPNDDISWRQFLSDPSPASHTNSLVGQPVPVRLKGNSSWMWPWAVPKRWSCTHRQVPGCSSAPGPPALPVTQFHAGKLDYGSHWSTRFSALILLVKQWKRSSLSAMPAEAVSYLPKSRAYLLGAPC